MEYRPLDYSPEVISAGHTNSSPSPTRKRFGSLSGRKADRQRNRDIANIVNVYDDRWWFGSKLWKSELGRICTDLDRAQIAVPPSWTEGRTQQLLQFGVDARSWCEALDLGFRQLVIDQIRYHLQRCLRKL